MSDPSERTDHAAAAPERGTAGPPWFTRGVAGIGSAGLLTYLGHEVPTALLPSLVTLTLGAPTAALHLIEGVRAVLNYEIFALCIYCQSCLDPSRPAPDG